MVMLIINKTVFIVKISDTHHLKWRIRQAAGFVAPNGFFYSSVKRTGTLLTHGKTDAAEPIWTSITRQTIAASHSFHASNINSYKISYKSASRLHVLLYLIFSTFRQLYLLLKHHACKIYIRRRIVFNIIVMYHFPCLPTFRERPNPLQCKWY